jgi:hypothetical protein
MVTNLQYIRQLIHLLVLVTAIGICCSPSDLRAQNVTPALTNEPGAANPWPYPAYAAAGIVPLGNLGQEAQFSVSLWVNPAAGQYGQAVLMDASHAGGTNWVIQSVNAGATWVFLGCEFVLQPNAWQHLLCTYDNGVATVFINGVLDDQAAWQIAWGAVPNVFLGNWPEGGRRFQGSVDDVLITRNVLYNNNFNPPETFPNANIPANSLGMWHCQEGVGLVTVNDVNNQNTNLNGWVWGQRPLTPTPSTSTLAASVYLNADILELGSQVASRLAVGTGNATVKFPYVSGTLALSGVVLAGPTASVLFDAASSNRDGYLTITKQNVSRTTYANLFNVVGATYGAGDGTTTFGLPDADIVPRDGLVGWWPFNGNADDASGAQRNGVVTGATLTADRFGYPQSAYAFDGNDYITIPHDLAITTDAGTLSLWFKMTALNRQALLVYKGAAGTAVNEHVSLGYVDYYANTGAQLESGAKFNSNCQANAGWVKAYSGPTSYQDNKWHNAIVTWGDGFVRLYVDGVLLAETASPNQDADNCNGGPLYIGRGWVNTLADAFNGTIDDVALYNRIVTASERGRLLGAESPRLRLIMKH